MTRWMGLALLLVTAMATATEKEAPAPTEPYAIELWGKAAYDAAGKLSTLTFIDAEDYPATFLARVEARLRQMPVEQKLVEGVPATFDTGIMVSLTITPKAGGADARIDDIAHSPGILRKAVVRYPSDLARIEGWKGTVVAQCTVDVAGRCGPVEVVREDPGMPESGRRFAKDSLARWRFEPQRVAGKPVTSVVRIPFHLQTRTSSLPPRYFGK